MAIMFKKMLCRAAAAVCFFVQASESFVSSSPYSQRRMKLALCATGNNTDDNIDALKKGKGGTWNPFALAVLKLGFTEPAWTSPLNYQKKDGIYSCANCNTPLFSSSGKFDSGSGWPSFWKTIQSNRVSLEREWDGRIECKCSNCDGHLGHIFSDGPARGSLDANELETVPDTDPQIGYKVQGSDAGGKDSQYSRMPRFCVNGAAMRFEEDTYE